MSTAARSYVDKLIRGALTSGDLTEMFERYTETARRAIFFARYEASQFGAQSIEPEHLLLGVSREDKPLLIQILPDGEETLERIRRSIEDHSPTKERVPTSVELPLAPETKRVLHYAHDESDHLKHRHIGTEHLLLGLMRAEDSVAARILFELGLRLDAMRDVAQRIKAPRPYVVQTNRPNGRRHIMLGVERLQQMPLLRSAREGLACTQAP